MHGGVTAGTPTAPQAQKSGVILATDKNPGAAGGRTLCLSVTLEAEVIVGFDQQLRVDGAMWVVANGAPFAQCFMFEDKRP